MMHSQKTPWVQVRIREFAVIVAIVGWAARIETVIEWATGIDAIVERAVIEAIVEWGMAMEAIGNWTGRIAVAEAGAIGIVIAEVTAPDCTIGIKITDSD